MHKFPKAREHTQTIKILVKQNVVASSYQPPKIGELSNLLLKEAYDILRFGKQVNKGSFPFSGYTVKMSVFVLDVRNITRVSPVLRTFSMATSKMLLR